MWNMMCDVLPTISEDSISQRSSQFSGEDANFEQLMVSMLDERDKLMDSLREAQERLNEMQAKMLGCEKERDSLQRQLAANLPQVRHLPSIHSFNHSFIHIFFKFVLSLLLTPLISLLTLCCTWLFITSMYLYISFDRVFPFLLDIFLRLCCRFFYSFLYSFSFFLFFLHNKWFPFDSHETKKFTQGFLHFLSWRSYAIIIRAPQDKKEKREKKITKKMKKMKKRKHNVLLLTNIFHTLAIISTQP